MLRILGSLPLDPELVLFVLILPGVIALLLCPHLLVHMRGRLKRRGLSFQFGLSQCILIPVVLTPGLALMGREESRALSVIFFVNAILGIVLGWGDAYGWGYRQNPSSLRSALSVALGGLGVTIVGMVLLLGLWLISRLDSWLLPSMAGM